MRRNRAAATNLLEKRKVSRWAENIIGIAKQNPLGRKEERKSASGATGIPIFWSAVATRKWPGFERTFSNASGGEAGALSGLLLIGLSRVRCAFKFDLEPDWTFAMKSPSFAPGRRWRLPKKSPLVALSLEGSTGADMGFFENVNTE